MDQNYYRVDVMEAMLESKGRIKFDAVEKVSLKDGECLRAVASSSMRIAEMERLISKSAGLTPPTRVKANGTSRAPVDRLDYALESNGTTVTASLSDNGAFGISVQSDTYRLEDESVFANALRKRLMHKIIDALESG